VTLFDEAFHFQRFFSVDDWGVGSALMSADKRFLRKTFRSDPIKEGAFRKKRAFFNMP